MKRKIVAVLLALILITAAGCSSNDNQAQTEAESNSQLGTLEFKANGEDFVRQGFVSKDGWNISFDHVYLTLSEINAYITDPPYEAEEHKAIEADNMVSLPGTFTVNLAEGGEDADTISVGTIEVPAGFYNAISWKMIQAASGDAEGNTILIIGSASKDSKTIPFRIGIDKEYQYYAGEYVGNERKGIVEPGSTADLEMTFHFNHIFGDADTPAEDGLNAAAIGFAPFAALAQDGKIDAVAEDIESGFSTEEYNKYLEILPTLGHVGEGHAFAEEL